MADCEIGEFVAIIQDLIDKFTMFLNYICIKGKQRNKKKIWITFLFLISKLKGFEF